MLAAPELFCCHGHRAMFDVQLRCWFPRRADSLIST
jgi:hypothetical protein